MKPIKNIRNNQEKPSLIKLSNEEDDRPLLSIKNKNENSLILPPSSSQNNNNITNKSLLRNHYQSIDKNNNNKKLEQEIDDSNKIDKIKNKTTGNNKNDTHNNHNNNNNNNNNKSFISNKNNRYEENEEWLLKNTDKLIRNLFDRQKKWEDTRSEIQQSIEKIKNDENNDSPENKALSEKEKKDRETKRKIELGLNKIKKLDEILEQKYMFEKELKEKNSSQEFLSETDKQFLMKYDIEVPTTFLKDEILEKQKKIPLLKREESSANLLLNYSTHEIQSLINKNENENENENEKEEKENNEDKENNEEEKEEEEEEEEYFNPTKQNIIKKVVDFSTENQKDKDRLKILFSNKTFLTETKSLPISMFISKPDIDDIDIDLDDDPELLKLKMGGDARYYYALTDEEKLRLEAILQLPDEELETSSAYIINHKEGEKVEKGEKEGTVEGKENNKEIKKEKEKENENSIPKEILVDPDDYIKNDSKKTLKNGYLPSVEEFNTLKDINEKLHKLVPASEWLKRKTESNLFNTSLLSNNNNQNNNNTQPSMMNFGFWSSQNNLDYNGNSQVSLFSNHSTISNKSNVQDSVYSGREKRENKKKMKEINEKLSELQQLRNNFESEYNIYEKQNEDEILKYESIFDKLDMKEIESQIELANEKLLSMNLDSATIEEKNNLFSIDFEKGDSESILDQIDIKKMESEIELDNQRLEKMKSESILTKDFLLLDKDKEKEIGQEQEQQQQEEEEEEEEEFNGGNLELYTTENADKVTSKSITKAATINDTIIHQDTNTNTDMITTTTTTTSTTTNNTNINDDNTTNTNT
ncbi:hypothetical protein BCR32DRAFT_266809 [Anaeromyces robustus]|uniref:Fibrous sheath-interacting protein 1 n=1 Tax=Anaeromyces robustus TaxID=1754192 RepID=A0A1Y1XD93_9FUNG|nr:hypothetical protein BCR32DRAFT_266809 [Anaeromyces robustus]|eukprot:ORX83652.1 hypothetical protein BCR32DRAFT_266809 [Anaeromyces robustus]